MTKGNKEEVSTTAATELLLRKLESENRLVDWDDGFTPSGCSGRKGRMVISQPRSTPGLISVVDNVLPDELAQNMYNSAIEAKVWGEYIKLDDLDTIIATRVSPEESTLSDENRRYMAGAAVHSFFRQRCANLISKDWNNAHGVSVWVIASDVGDSVQYHIDYAEMFRFQTNIIYPPIYGATLHLTPPSQDTKIQGGSFHANAAGLEHYKEYKYKCPLDKLDFMNSNEGNDWIMVPYKYNRGTLCDGELPHFSAPVKSIPDGMKRVIVGFNVCNHEIGPIVEQYPEHSSKFNKWVKLSQATVKFNNNNGLTVEDAKRNPKIGAFIKLLAKLQKEREERENSHPNDV